MESDTWAVVCSLKPSLLQIQAGLFEIKRFLSEATHPQSSPRPTCLHRTPVVPGRDRGVRCSPLRPPGQESSTVWIHIVRLVLQTHPATTTKKRSEAKQKEEEVKQNKNLFRPLARGRGNQCVQRPRGRQTRCAAFILFRLPLPNFPRRRSTADRFSWERGSERAKAAATCQQQHGRYPRCECTHTHTLISLRSRRAGNVNTDSIHPE